METQKNLENEQIRKLENIKAPQTVERMIVTENQLVRNRLLETIPIEKITYGNNVRENYADDAFENLKDSISTRGILELITVYKESEGYKVKLGNTRLRACKELYAEGDSRFKTIECYVTQIPNKNEIVIDQIIENLRRKDLTDADLLYIFPTLREQGFSDDKICELYKGRSKKTVQNIFSIINDIKDDEELTKMLNDGTTTLAKISETKKIENKDTRLKLLKENNKTSTPDFRKIVKAANIKTVNNIPVDGNEIEPSGKVSVEIKHTKNQIILTIKNGKIEELIDEIKTCIIEYEERTNNIEEKKSFLGAIKDKVVGKGNNQ